eukprot:TRINITY_DN56569_c0_g1_i1.p1 TRINITY_DN56569_c0_g1~~TRINITY_DN56569_c0_g1_i1.p1  ORF type:complete len:156 (-),score=36.41 TRINITY_DN56569_c0_g1_i1:208-621(-)
MAPFSVRSALALASLLVAAAAAAGTERTLIISPVESSELADAIESAMQRELPRSRWGDQQPSVQYLSGLHVVLVRDIPEEAAEALLETLRREFATTETGKQRHFEWDGAVSIKERPDPDAAAAGEPAEEAASSVLLP